MARRRTIEEPPSRLAIWARRVALFSLAATLIAVIIVRSGALEIVPALSTLAGALVLAVVAILLAIGAAIVIWYEGVGGKEEAVTALFIGLALIAYPLYLGVKGYRLPAIYDITTDPIDPPRFDAIARLRPRDANPITYAGLYAAELQHAAYSDIEPDLTNSTPQEAYDAALRRRSCPGTTRRGFPSNSASTSTFMKPSVSPFSKARETSSMAILPTSARRPLRRTSASVIPARPSGGSV